jgi:hypothetical protein
MTYWISNIVEAITALMAQQGSHLAPLTRTVRCRYGFRGRGRSDRAALETNADWLLIDEKEIETRLTVLSVLIREPLNARTPHRRRRTPEPLEPRTNRF